MIHEHGDGGMVLHVSGCEHVNGRMRMGEFFYDEYMFQMIEWEREVAVFFRLKNV